MRYRFLKTAALATLTLAAFSPTMTQAQEVLYTPSATSPGKGVPVTRHIFSYESYDGVRGNGPYTLNQYTMDTAFVYGISADLTFMMHVPLTFRDFNEPPGSQSEKFGIEDLDTMLKYRFYQDDIGNIDTVRMSAMLGIELPSYDDGFSSDSFDPFIGWAMTAIEGRHGVGAHAKYQFNTGNDETGIEFSDTKYDAVRLDGSYLYRIDPAEYTIDTNKSTYIMVELNNRYETSGDFETLISPGLLIEATNWSAELAVRIPVIQELDRRADMDWALTFGLRFSY